MLRVLNLPGYSQQGPAGFGAVRAKMALALAHQGALDTIDYRIALNAVVGAEKAHLLLL